MIAHVVFDEAHIPIIAKDYHKTLNNIYQVCSLPMQLVLLSATLPPSFMPELATSYNLLFNVTVIRQSTNRPEHIYLLEKISLDEFLDRTIQILDEKEEDWREEDRALIFVTSITLGQKLVDITNHAFYVGDRDKMSDTECQTAYRQWMDGTKNVMVVTSAFSTGNDYRHVHLVIHLDKPFNMLEFVQGQGRAGRDIQAAKCYLLTPKEAGRPSTKEAGLMMENKVAMYEHVYTYGLKRCLRYGISSYIDGTGVSCRALACNQLCCVCLRDPQHDAEAIHLANMPKSKAAIAKNVDDRRPSLHTPTPADSSSSMSVMPQELFAQAAKRAKQMTSMQQQHKNAKVEDMVTALRRLEDICCLCQVLGEESGVICEMVDGKASR
ncbi:hypothetical protein PAXRUDRAFT_21330 [Paxillus rubicundulus Ve08.2h10]|uniref:DNA 3'-5' helicase n=1 Tax=Paxillus rubicundulus Ve08.2h10 TaxID=930991 RepID=A0A0D0CC09_9AGAM|nr:hypothetical protein PAXRUDRAFT_21330 [Paxillus rubicundulus Ve08.2h10]